MNNPKLYTVKEAAKIVGVSTNTLYKYLDEDRIHAARGSAVQGRFRIPQSALEEFLGIKLSEPETANGIETVGADPRVRPTESEGQTLQDSEPLTSRITEPLISLTSPRLPLKLIRFLLVLALIAILIDLILSPTLNLASTLTRLFFVAIMILLSYQEGGYRKG